MSFLHRTLTREWLGAAVLVFEGRAARPHPLESQYWMQLNDIRRGANLTMIVIEETNTGHSNDDWLVGRIRLG